MDLRDLNQRIRRTKFLMVTLQQSCLQQVPEWHQQTSKMSPFTSSSNIETWHLSAIHLPGELNTCADSLSQTCANETKWSLNEKHLISIFKVLSHPQVDAFATKNNGKCTVFFARGLPTWNFLRDAFLHKWSRKLFYLFSQFLLILHVHQKIVYDRT